MADLMYWDQAAFRWVWQTSWQATILVVLILSAQWLLRRRLSAAWRYGLWVLLIVRLLMPDLPASRFSIFNLTRASLANSTVAAQTPARTGEPSLHPLASVLDASPGTDSALAKPLSRARVNSSMLSPGAGNRGDTPPGINWPKVACSTWLLGVVLFALRVAWANVRFRRHLAQRRTLVNVNAISVFDQCKREFNLNQSVRIVESEEVETPGVYGIWRKWLLLPMHSCETLSTEELRHTLLHELAHLKRRDLEANALIVCLQILHWFNPVIWMAFRRMRADRELATDALVLAHMSAADNTAYGETIIKLAANLARRGMQPSLIGIAESKADLQARLRAIGNAGLRQHWTLAAIGIVAILGAAGLTGARGNERPAPAKTSMISALALKETPSISGRIVDGGGRPVNQAQIAIYRLSARTWFDGTKHGTSSGLDLRCTPIPRIFNPKFGHPMAELHQAREAWSFCTTDSRGQFVLNDLDRALGLIAVQESGFALIGTNGFSTNMTVQLTPWGRIEGTLWHYDEPVTNESICASFTYQEGVPRWGSESKFTAKTDVHGHFALDFVPPGQFAVSSDGMIGEHTVVKAGQTTIVKLGGSGSPVIGKFIIRNPEGGIEPADGLRYHLFTSSAGLNGVGTLNTQQLPDAISTYFHSRAVQCAKDGSFRIDQVPPGKYVLSVEAVATSTAHSRWLFGQGQIEIPANDSKMQKPLDLGAVEIMLQPPAPDRGLRSQQGF